MTKKVCRQCHQDIELAFFERKKSSVDGYTSDCKVCRNADTRRRYHERIDRERQKTFKYVQEGFQFERVCASCKVKKQVHEFGIDRQPADGISRYCKQCKAAQGARYFQKHKDRVLRRHQAWVVANREKAVNYTRKWQTAHPQETKLSAKQSNRKHKHKRNAYTRHRHAMRKAHTPAWANHEEIKKFYHYAVLMSRISGIQHDVDHMVPIISKLVSGMHCEYNLNIIPSRENISKNNRYWPDMW